MLLHVQMIPAQNDYKIYAKYTEEVTIFTLFKLFWMSKKYKNVILQS